MGEFTINGTRNLDIFQQAAIETYKPTFLLPGADASGIKADHGDFLFQVAHLKNCSIWLDEYRMKESAMLHGAVNAPVMELHCMLTGGMNYQTDGLGIVSMPRGTFNLHQQPYVNNRVFLPQNSQVITFNVLFQPEYLYDFCKVYPQLEGFIEQHIRKNFSLLQPEAQPLTMELSNTIQSILTAPVRGSEQLHILSAVIHSFMLQALSYLTSLVPARIRITNQHKEIVEEIKVYLLQDLDEHTLIPDLAYRFGINDCLLKMVFKEITGLTIFQYLTRERMTKATWLLKNTKLSIEEIAYTVGYKDACGFGYRFKKIFFISPLQYRNGKG